MVCFMPVGVGIPLRMLVFLGVRKRVSVLVVHLIGGLVLTVRDTGSSVPPLIIEGAHRTGTIISPLL